MPVDTSGFDPIVNAIFRYGQTRQQQARDAEDVRVNKVKEKENIDRQKQQDDQFQQQQDLARQHLDLQKSQNEREIAAQENQLKEHAFTRLYQTISQGGEPQSGAPQVQFNPPGSGLPPQAGPATDTVRDPLTGQDFARSLFPTQESIQQNKLGEKRGELALTDEFAAKKQERDAAYDQKILQQKQIFDHNEGKLDRDQRAQLAQINEQGANYRAQLAAQTRLKGGLGDIDEDTISNYINDMYVTGNTNESQVPQKIRATIKGTVPLGWTPVTKRDSEQIDGLPLMAEFFKTASDLADKGSTIKGKADILLGGFGEAGRVKKEVDGLMGNIARIFGGEKGVLTQRDIERGQGLVYQILQGSKGNKQLVQDLADTWGSKLQGFVKKYPDEQRKQIFGARAIPDDIFQTAGKQGKEAAPIEFERGPDGKLRRKGAK